MPLDRRETKPFPASQLCFAHPQPPPKNAAAKAGIVRRPNHLVLCFSIFTCARYPFETIGLSMLVCLLLDTWGLRIRSSTGLVRTSRARHFPYPPPPSEPRPRALDPASPKGEEWVSYISPCAGPC